MSTLLDRVRKALSEDKEIAIPRNLIHTAKGHSLQYMAHLGLSKNDLKKLEANGLAAKGYAKYPSGHKAMWILLSDTIEVPNDDKRMQDMPSDESKGSGEEGSERKQ